MYNYGVIDNTYVIIMKKYQTSLQNWSLQKIKQKGMPNGWNLASILTIYYQVLKVVKFLHENIVTHYDIKGDNIMLDFSENGDIIPIFGDFGQYQLDMKSRGTQCIQSPQMLTLSLHNKRQVDNFDRRKKIGTSRASDIWSLGYLLYQMITGDLYYRVDWFKFYDQMHKYQLKRFENLYTLLVPNPQPQSSIPRSPVIFQQTLQNLLQKYLTHQKIAKLSPHRENKPLFKLLRLMQDIYFCYVNYFLSHQNKIRLEGITHVITTLSYNMSFYNVLFIKNPQQYIASKLRPRVSDMLRLGVQSQFKRISMIG